MPGLKELRRLGGLTQSRAAQASGINRARYSQAECGEIQLSLHEHKVVRRVLFSAIRDRSELIRAVLSEAQSEAPK